MPRRKEGQGPRTSPKNSAAAPPASSPPASPRSARKTWPRTRSRTPRSSPRPVHRGSSAASRWSWRSSTPASGACAPACSAASGARSGWRSASPPLRPHPARPALVHLPRLPAPGPRARRQTAGLGGGRGDPLADAGRESGRGRKPRGRADERSRPETARRSPGRAPDGERRSPPQAQAARPKEWLAQRVEAGRGLGAAPWAACARFRWVRISLMIRSRRGSWEVSTWLIAAATAGWIAAIRSCIAWATAR